MNTDWSKLDECIPAMQAAWQVPGVAVAVVQGGEVVYARGFGARAAGQPGAVDADTIFAIGSNTKAFTATAVGLLVQEGRLKWDDRVTDYLPGFQLADPIATREMTVRDLMCHRSGLISYGGDLMSYGTSYTSEEVLRRARYIQPVYPFRSTYGYSNIMFLAAGKVVEKVSGKTWQAFVRERLLHPLGMQRTLTGLDGLSQTGNVAQPHALFKGKIYPVEYASLEADAPAGSINSSVLDLAQWLRLQLANGVWQGKQLVDASILEETRLPHTLVPQLPDFRKLVFRRHFTAYGLGWFLSDYGGRLVMSHGGGVDGMLSQTGFVPEADLGWAILTNLAPNGLFTALGFTILDLGLGLPEHDWQAALLAYEHALNEKADAERRKLEEARRIDVSPSLPPEDYTGIYTNPVYGRITVTLEDRHLCLSLEGHPGLRGPMKPWHADSFLCAWSIPTYEESFVHFQIGMDGKAEKFRLKVGDFIDLQEYEFTREAPGQ